MIRCLYFIILALTLLMIPVAHGQSRLPVPAKSDVPYIIHAASLVETEQSEANEEAHKNERLYVVPGVVSGARTPLAGPEFLFQSESINPHDLELYRFELKNGRRELLFQRKRKILAEPLRITVFPMNEDLVRIRVYESSSTGEYCLTPNSSNTVFCFTVY